jgi:hypothetical protein
VTFVAAKNPFEAWNAKPVADLTKAQFAFFFQKDGDDTYYEDGDTANVWSAYAATATTYSTAAPTGDAVYVTTALEMKGAVSLTAAAASAIVASLLF